MEMEYINKMGRHWRIKTEAGTSRSLESEVATEDSRVTHRIETKREENARAQRK